MQLAPTLDLALLGLPGILLGMLLGYVFGGVETLRARDRLSLGIISSFVGGMILSLIIVVYHEIQTMEMIFIILSFFGGYLLGVFSNWTPTYQPRAASHIIYDPEDEDAEFDRQIKEALGGSE
ncbi:MAG: hypothetical protein ACTSV3_05650 [Candidatus Thorarchaeota archaeon]|nr:MAG: hypothetical protein DRP09_05875 [Candidatus Thorarchaeota archaeon]RLI58373.1 MAG: hypothetical protein DRO87_05910 [Candidatus Thorarchaeota archaeon]